MRCIVLVVLLTTVLCAGAASLDTRVVNQQGKPVADAVVYLEPIAAAKQKPRPAGSIAVTQLDREFVPYVTPVLTGTAVSFPNLDPMRHHVYSFSRPKVFEIKLYRGDAPSRVVFDKPGVIALGCNIHDWMLGFIFVLDTPHFAKTDAEGRARIADLVPADYELKVWHPDQRTSIPARAVQVAQQNTTAELSIEITPRARKYKPPEDPARYRE